MFSDGSKPTSVTRCNTNTRTKALHFELNSIDQDRRDSTTCTPQKERHESIVKSNGCCSNWWVAQKGPFAGIVNLYLLYIGSLVACFCLLWVASLSQLLVYCKLNVLRQSIPAKEILENRFCRESTRQDHVVTLVIWSFSLQIRWQTCFMFTSFSHFWTCVLLPSGFGFCRVFVANYLKRLPRDLAGSLLPLGTNRLTIATVDMAFFSSVFWCNSLHGQRHLYIVYISWYILWYIYIYIYSTLVLNPQHKRWICTCHGIFPCLTQSGEMVPE